MNLIYRFTDLQIYGFTDLRIDLFNLQFTDLQFTIYLQFSGFTI